MRIFKSNNNATQFTFINNFIFTFLFKLKSIGFDHAINYKKESIDDRLFEYAPNGIDIFYDKYKSYKSVGG